MLLTAVLLSLLLVIALLLAPLVLEFKLSWPRTGRSEVMLLWGFGVVRKRIFLAPPAAGSSRKTEAPPKRKTASAAPTGKRRRSRRGPTLGTLLRAQAVRQRLLTAAGQLWRAFDRRRLEFYLRIGLGDPSDTGQLWALLGPLAAWFATLDDVVVTMEPDFVAQDLELRGAGTIRFQPLRVLAVLVALGLSPALWRASRPQAA